MGNRLNWEKANSKDKARQPSPEVLASTAQQSYLHKLRPDITRNQLAKMTRKRASILIAESLEIKPSSWATKKQDEPIGPAKGSQEPTCNTKQYRELLKLRPDLRFTPRPTRSLCLAWIEEARANHPQGRRSESGDSGCDKVKTQAD